MNFVFGLSFDLISIVIDLTNEDSSSDDKEL